MAFKLKNSSTTFKAEVPPSFPIVEFKFAGGSRTSFFAFFIAGIRETVVLPGTDQERRETWVQLVGLSEEEDVRVAETYEEALIKWKEALSS